MYFLTVFERIRGIQDDPVVSVKTPENFERGSVIAANHQGTQPRLLIGIHHDGAQSFRSEQQGIDGNLQSLPCRLYLQMNLGETTGKKEAIFVGNVDFGLQSSCRE